MVGGEGIACVDASERAGLHTIFATGAASTTGRACDDRDFMRERWQKKVLLSILARVLQDSVLEGPQNRVSYYY